MGDTKKTMLVASRKGLFLFERRDGDWVVAGRSHLGFPVPYAKIDPRDGTLWASLDHGHWGQKLHRSKDRGETWEEVEAPAYPEGTMVRDGVKASTNYIWLLAAAPADRPGVLYAGTEPGGLFRSDDGGTTWKLVEGLWNHPSREKLWMGGGRDEAAVHSIVFDPLDSDHMLIGASVAGVFETTDGGDTWEPRNSGLIAEYLPEPDPEVGHDPHLLVAAPSDFSVMWQQNHCGIFRSDTGARSWEKVSQPGGPAHFGFAVAVHEEKPERAWVVPALSDEQRMAIDGTVVVCRTDDGGENWTEQRTGLPQSDAYDITFRHALDVTGETVAFGTTTGNLFLSDDGGNRWRCLGNHFPPIYSVRFA